MFFVPRNIVQIPKITKNVLLYSAQKKGNWTKENSNPISVSLIQSNIDQNIKWNYSNLQSTLKLFNDFTEDNLDKEIYLL